MVRVIYKIFVFLFIYSVSISCENNNTYLHEYGQSLHYASEPKEPVLKFTKKTQELAPDIRLANYYEFLLANWEFKADEPGKDIVNNANTMISGNFFEGDCEDFCVLLMSINKTIGLTTRFCLGTSKRDKKKGHIWVETMLCEVKYFDETFKNRIVANFRNSNFPNTFSIINRNDTIWIQLNTVDMINNYNLTHFVDMKGNLIEYQQ